MIYIVGRKGKRMKVFTNKNDAAKYATKIGSKYINKFSYNEAIKLRVKKKKK